MSTDAIGAVGGNFTSSVSAISGVGHAGRKDEIELFGKDFGSKGVEETSGSLANNNNLFSTDSIAANNAQDKKPEETAGVVAFGRHLDFAA